MTSRRAMLLAPVLWLAAVSTAEAVCAPEKMVKIVTRIVAPPAAAGSFAAKPKTLYRLGNKYGRVEESPDPGHALHLLVVVNEPDVWTVNRIDRTGRHMVDPGPTLDFRAPIFEKPGMPRLLTTLELGCERAFLTWNRARLTGGDSVRGRRCGLQTVDIADFRVTICLDSATQKPARTSVYERGALLLSMEYDEYQDDLAPNRKLFERPAGIAFSEAPR